MVCRYIIYTLVWALGMIRKKWAYGESSFSVPSTHRSLTPSMGQKKMFVAWSSNITKWKTLIKSGGKIWKIENEGCKTGLCKDRSFIITWKLSKCLSYITLLKGRGFMISKTKKLLHYDCLVHFLRWVQGLLLELYRLKRSNITV